MGMTPNLGSYIRALREAKKVSLREVAVKVGVSAAFMSDIELGRRYPARDVLEKIAKVLDVPVAEMVENDNRVRGELKDWLEKHPELKKILADFQQSGRPAEELISAWRRASRPKKG